VSGRDCPSGDTDGDGETPVPPERHTDPKTGARPTKSTLVAVTSLTSPIKDRPRPVQVAGTVLAAPEVLALLVTHRVRETLGAHRHSPSRFTKGMD
jgi:hypothetical protein